MKILLLSDIHANIYALEAIARQETWDAVWCCGDLVDYGPYPMEVIQWMRSSGAKAVLGNHDAHVLSLTQESCRDAYARKRWQWAHQNYSQLDAQALAYLAALPRQLQLDADGIAYQMQHQYDARYGTVESLDQFSAFWQGPKTDGLRRLLFGHTHRQGMHWLSETRQWLNPGSASYRRPDDPDKQAQYMCIEDGVVRFCGLSYDRSPLLSITRQYCREGHMLETDLQDAFFFFGDAPTTREKLPNLSSK